MEKSKSDYRIAVAGLPTETLDRPKVSCDSGDLRSAVSAGSETRAERAGSETRAEREGSETRAEREGSETRAERGR